MGGFIPLGIVIWIGFEIGGVQGFLFVAGLFAFLAIIVLWDDIRRYFSHCRHGVWKGQEHNRCSECTKEKLEQEMQQALDEKRDAEIASFNENSDTLKKEEIARIRKEFFFSPENIEKLDPYEFEEATAELFRQNKYEVETTKKAGDMGRDAIMHKDGKKYLLECKRYSEKTSVGRPDIQKFHSAIITDKAEGGFFVNTGRYTAEAKEYAKKVNVTLYSSTDLASMSEQNSSLKGRFDYRGICPDCGNDTSNNLYKPTTQKCSCGAVVAASIHPSELFGSKKQSCPDCGGELVHRKGRNGKFLGCSSYPKCRYTESLNKGYRSKRIRHWGT